MSEHDPIRVRVTDKRRTNDLQSEAQGPVESIGPEPELVDAQPSEPEAAQAVPEDDLARERDEARAQADAYLDDLRRLKAEFENFRKRMVREQTAIVERATQGVVERLLPILDNFELALLAADRTKDYEAMVRGVEIVYGELLELLRREGLERIEALGRPFDPEVHEAVMQAEGEGDQLMVVDEMRAGYKIGDRVVRPAMVKVGRTDR